MREIEDIRKEFPFLKTSLNGRPVVYFDNAATSQRPLNVIESINRWNTGANANVHRAVHYLSGEATENYENGREAVRSFINASSRKEIIFTSGTTASVNLLANSFGSRYVKKGDIILLSEVEHHSNMIPWQFLCERTGAELRYIPIDENGHWILDGLETLLSQGKVKLISVAHISNVLGIINPVEEVIAAAHKYGIPVHLDGAQGIVHEEVDVQKMDCDFYSFSGHKIYAATGTGILYGKEKYLKEMHPWMGGGDMVGTVDYYKTTFADLPLKFEAGTPNFIGGATFTPALEFVKSVRNLNLKRYERDMMDYLEEEFNTIDGLRVYGTGKNKIPLYSFTVEGVHHSDLAMILDKMGIETRSGMMCAEPLMSKFNQTGMSRISLAPYNDMEECEYFIKSLRKAIKMLK